MRKIVFSPEAIKDLEKIWLYIAPGIIIVVEHPNLELDFDTTSKRILSRWLHQGEILMMAF